MARPRLGILPLVAALALASNACTIGSGDGATAESTAATTTTTIAESEGDNALTIGLLVPTTGDGAAIGETIRTAVEQEVSAINLAGGVLGQRVRIRVADEGSDTGLSSLLDSGANPAAASNDSVKTKADPVDAIVGPTSSLVALRHLSDIVQAPNKVVTCSPSATALSLDKFDDDGLFFRTIPSDSLLMSAMVQKAQDTGQTGIAVAYIDDPYGRRLVNALETEIEDVGRLSLTGTAVPIPIDREDLSSDVETLLEGQPGVIVILANESVGGRLLSALDSKIAAEDTSTTVLVNDSVRTARAAIEGLSEPMRNRVRAIVPKTTFEVDEVELPPFAAQAMDCVDLIALAAVQGESDARRDIKLQISLVSQGGQACTGFADCSSLLEQGRVIDYVGRSGQVNFNESGEPNRGWFEAVSFGPDGFEASVTPFEAS